MGIHYTSKTTPLYRISSQEFWDMFAKKFYIADIYIYLSCSSRGRYECRRGIYNSGTILGMGSTNERWHYNVTSSLIGWDCAQTDPCTYDQWTVPSLVQIMACCLFGNNPLSEPMMVYWRLNPKEHIKKIHMKMLSAKMAAILSLPQYVKHKYKIWWISDGKGRCHLYNLSCVYAVISMTAFDFNALQMVNMLDTKMRLNSLTLWIQDCCCGSFFAHALDFH